MFFNIEEFELLDVVGDESRVDVKMKSGYESTEHAWRRASFYLSHHESQRALLVNTSQLKIYFHRSMY